MVWVLIRDLFRISLVADMSFAYCYGLMDLIVACLTLVQWCASYVLESTLLLSCLSMKLTASDI
jgi:hypothetical protein